VVYWSEFLATDPEALVRFPALPEKKEVGLERGSLSLVSTTEELLDRKVAATVYKTENTAVGIRHAYHVAPSIRKKLAITSPTSGYRSVGIVRSRTQTMEFFYNLNYTPKSLRVQS
jgi:CTP synthase (UTP-ammonia lyase)